jgi:hypothetical protein
MGEGTGEDDRGVGVPIAGVVVEAVVSTHGFLLSWVFGVVVCFK